MACCWPPARSLARSKWRPARALVGWFSNYPPGSKLCTKLSPASPLASIPQRGRRAAGAPQLSVLVSSVPSASLSLSRFARRRSHSSSSSAGACCSPARPLACLLSCSLCRLGLQSAICVACGCRRRWLLFWWCRWWLLFCFVCFCWAETGERHARRTCGGRVGPERRRLSGWTELEVRRRGRTPAAAAEEAARWQINGKKTSRSKWQRLRVAVALRLSQFVLLFSSSFCLPACSPACSPTQSKAAQTPPVATGARIQPRLFAAAAAARVVLVRALQQVRALAACARRLRPHSQSWHLAGVAQPQPQLAHLLVAHFRSLARPLVFEPLAVGALSNLRATCRRCRLRFPEKSARN